MIIIHRLDNPDPMLCTVFLVMPGPIRLTESGGKLWAEGVYKPIISDAAIAGWLAFPEQYVPPPEYEDDDIERGDEIPRTVTELGLTPFGPGNLPESQVLAKLIAVNIGAVRPLTVRRTLNNALYDVDCFVSQTVVNMWIDGDLAIGDPVIVSYMAECAALPVDVAPIVTDRVYKTW